MTNDLDDYDFDLPPDRIAQEPAAVRDASRALFCIREQSAIESGRFRDIAERVRGDEVFVVNDTRVIPARVHARRQTGGRVECFVLKTDSAGRAKAWLSPSKKLSPGETLEIVTATGEPIGETIEIGERETTAGSERVWNIGIAPDAPERFGDVPLPPYIERAPDDGRSTLDRDRYQTRFADRPGAVAAPTAGLHFTDALIADLESRGVEFLRVTLHVGPGTFEPVRTDDLSEHRVAAEFIDVSAKVHQRLLEVRAEGRPIVAIGTTTTRTLESLPPLDETPEAEGRTGETDLTIRPGYHFRNVDGLVTNFHLPKSSLLVLVSAFHGRERVLDAYRRAVDEGFRFYSYGDAMVIAPNR